MNARTLAVCRDEWPALVWEANSYYARGEGRDRFAGVTVYQVALSDEWRAASRGRVKYGKTPRAALRALRYAMCEREP